MIDYETKQAGGERGAYHVVRRPPMAYLSKKEAIAIVGPDRVEVICKMTASPFLAFVPSSSKDPEFVERKSIIWCRTLAGKNAYLIAYSYASVAELTTAVRKAQMMIASAAYKKELQRKAAEDQYVTIFDPVFKSYHACFKEISGFVIERVM